MIKNVALETIPMTEKNKKIWDKALEESKDDPNDFTYFLDILDCQTHIGDTSVVLDMFPEFIQSSKRLMLAWLFTDLIDEVEE